jgi:translation initiation factor 1
MRKRDERDAEGATRLVYSTGRDAPRSHAHPAGPSAERSTTPAARASGGKGIRLRLETRPGGRVVTLVLGLVGGEAELAALARVLKSACGTGGTVKDGVVELQGDHRMAAQAALAGQGLKARI